MAIVAYLLQELSKTKTYKSLAITNRLSCKYENNNNNGSIGRVMISELHFILF